MSKLKKLIELAEKIKDENLRKKVIELLKDPRLSNEDFIYPASSQEEIPSSLNSHHARDKGHAEHVISVTELAIKIAKHVEKTYGTKINFDHLIAGALLHDWAKAFIFTKRAGKWEHSGCLLDHAVLSACELYARGFPEEVIHIVEAHGGDLGQVAARPQTLEALIVFYADVLDAAIDSFLKPMEQVRFLLLGEDEE